MHTLIYTYAERCERLCRQGQTQNDEERLDYAKNVKNKTTQNKYGDC